MLKNKESDDMKRILYLTLLLVASLSLVGCNKQVGKKAKKALKDENAVCIYYPQGNNVTSEEDAYLLKQPDSVTASIEEVMAAEANHLEAEISYNTYMIDGNGNVELTFVLEGDYKKEYFFLTKAAIASTLFQLEGVRNITILLNDAEGNDISKEVFNRNSFYFYGYKDM